MTTGYEVSNDPADPQQLLHELRLQQLELERQNEALRKSRESYHSFISQSHEAIYCTEYDQPIDISLPVEQQIDAIYQNAYLSECNQAMAEMYGFPSVEAFIGQRLVDFHGGTDNPTNRANYRKFIEANYRIMDSETEEVTSDGEKRFFLSNGIGIVENGYLLRIWGSAIDITALTPCRQLWSASKSTTGISGSPGRSVVASDCTVFFRVKISPILPQRSEPCRRPRWDFLDWVSWAGRWPGTS